MAGCVSVQHQLGDLLRSLLQELRQDLLDVRHHLVMLLGSWHDEGVQGPLPSTHKHDDQSIMSVLKRVNRRFVSDEASLHSTLYMPLLESLKCNAILTRPIP